jgi:hypothetical protein
MGFAGAREALRERAIDLVASPSPDEFAAYVKAEATNSSRLAREAGIKAE